MLPALFEIASYLLGILRMIVIIQYVMSLLINFNVINTHNDFVAGIWRALNILLEPFYRPLRRILPDTRPVDFSAMALLVCLTIAQIVLNHMELSLI